MVSIPGASQYLATATLSNLTGQSPSSDNVIGRLAIDLIDAARVNTGVGLSANSRALTKQFLESTNGLMNSILSLGLGPGATVEGMQKQILALRSTLPESQIAESLLTDASMAATDQNKGTNVDTSA